MSQQTRRGSLVQQGDHVHPEYRLRADHDRFEDRLLQRLDRLEELQSQTRVIVTRFAGMIIGASAIISLVAPTLRDILRLP